MPEIQGFLQKQGFLGGEYKGWHFRLEGQMLSYYEDANTVKPNGAMDILESILSYDKTTKNTDFELSCKGRSFVLKAGTHDERDEWIQAIKRQKLKLTASGNVDSLKLPVTPRGTSKEESLAKEVGELRKQCAQMKEKMQTAIKDREIALSEVEHLQKLLEVKMGDTGIHSLQMTQQWKKKCAKQEARIEKLTEENLGLSNKMKALNAAIADVTGEKVDYGKRIRRLSETNTTMSQQLSALEISKVENEASLNDEIKAVKDSRDDTEATLAKLMKKLEDFRSMTAWGFYTEEPYIKDPFWKLEVVSLTSKIDKEFTSKNDAHVEYVVVDDEGVVQGGGARTPKDGINSPIYLRHAANMKDLKDLFLCVQLKHKKNKGKYTKRSLIAWSFSPLQKLEAKPELCLQLYKKPFEFHNQEAAVLRSQALGQQMCVIRVSSFHGKSPRAERKERK
mmetsp:Transcript_7762/g.14441  ORF Transcript_7762/g.14441 Transcript_7762/m.14441 type:complete len:450 (+) Transcript_7762:153-1502(+)|eukprot:CAMPEP_0197515528 /NCGR_PEP_ID=MMETSP1318-20131121/635_1 /TAXON_ID=552666 /ORGANISM="Partenskyella glossopodia, Strain RCC365" /LENGTH=449 /DNA_ID=CAMNT_0043063925 /DNA_START=127 /DNA_END=1476 /DNA_ORIENTATION=+